MLRELFRKLIPGHTQGQNANRAGRTRVRDKELDHLIQKSFAADRAREFASLEELLRAFGPGGPLTPVNPDALLAYVNDWRQKAARGGTQAWVVLLDEPGRATVVVWNMVAADGTVGHKAWNLSDSTSDEPLTLYL